MVIVALEKSKFQVDISFPIFFSRFLIRMWETIKKDTVNNMYRQITLFTDTSTCIVSYAC